MEVISLSGIVAGNCEKKTDKNGNVYIRFKVSCKGKTLTGHDKVTIYRCRYWRVQNDDINDGDLVFVNGDMDATVKIDSNGKPWINFDVYVRQLEKGLNNK
jgi:hypothetical protein